MENRPILRTTNLPDISESDVASTASPARGREMRTSLQKKLRPPPLVHQWEFWHDRQDRNKKGSPAEVEEEIDYEARLIKLHSVTDVRDFWELFNNFDITTLPLRDSVHLFHRGVKPVWEDPRNVRGGAWKFRVSKEMAREFWKEVAMMAIGEELQQAVASSRITFIDDICGISLGVRFTSFVVSIWNRDAEHTEGVQNILQTVLAKLPENLRPRESSYHYKKHAEHSGFRPQDETPTLS